jgi:hypothetical protein
MQGAPQPIRATDRRAAALELTSLNNNCKLLLTHSRVNPGAAITREAGTGRFFARLDSWGQVSDG